VLLEGLMSQLSDFKHPEIMQNSFLVHRVLPKAL